ncbi:DNA mismatch endonuclease (patch repair protein) [Mycobacteroides chelonae]|nr:DNA mismatch endonuclease (patch repair protein) [Mycobacteroides chelonae]
MTSWASSPAVERSMQSNRGRDTGPEIRLRKLLWARGLRYRVSIRPVPDINFRADIVFRPSRIAVDVRGCFWHGCPHHYRAPARNRAFWQQKLEQNRARDSRNEDCLAAAGWLLIVVWEHEDFIKAAEDVARSVELQRIPVREHTTARVIG